MEKKNIEKCWKTDGLFAIVPAKNAEYDDFE